MKHDNKPLTLEELRQMEGQPVWIDSINPLLSQWAIVEYGDIDNVISFQDSKNELNLIVSWYGKTWLAYAQKSIDFDDWTAEWKEVVTHNGCTPDYDCVCSKCGASGTPNGNFCSVCGRAMNDEARQLLEKRLAGHINEQ